MTKSHSHLVTSVSRFQLRYRGGGERGSILLGVMIVMILLAGGLGTYLSSLNNIEHLQDQRVMNDRAFMAAEAGLAKAFDKLQGLLPSNLPTSDQVWPMDVPTEQFAPFQSVTVNVYPRPYGSGLTWTLSSTATSAAKGRTRAFSRRVQATFFQESFAKYEYFVNDFGGVWSPGSFKLEGFNRVFLGPYHSNSGIAFWPNLWMLNEATTAAPKGVRSFADFNTYSAGVYGKSDANDYANILQYYNSTYPNAPKFYKGLEVLPQQLSIPADLNVDVRAKQLRDNAGLKLPADYKGYNASKGPNFTVELTPGDKKSNNGQVAVRQYLGPDEDGKPSYGPKQTYNVNTINNAMIVYGNIKSFEGTLDGELTVGAFKKPPPKPGVPNPDPDPNDPGGSVDITGSLEYASREAIPDFKYTDDPNLYTPDHKDINQAYVDTLLNQLDKVTDVLGIVSEADVLIKEKDLNGNLVAADVNNPIHIDAVVMATGASASSTQKGGFGVENGQTRAKGAALTMGGAIQNYGGYRWPLFKNGVHTNGILQTRLWDRRTYKPGGAPPFFPTTGNLAVFPQSWRSSYVKNSAVPPLLPPF